MTLTSRSHDCKTHYLPIDDEHRELSRLLTTLNHGIAVGEAERAIEAALDHLFSTALQHCQSEEDLMEQYDYPDARAHTDAHQTLLNRILSLRLQFKTLPPQTRTDLMQDLATGLSLHSRKQDLTLAQWVQRQETVPTLDPNF